MAKDKDKQPVRDYGDRKRRVKKRRRFVILIAVFALLIGGSIYLYSLYNKNYKGFEVLSTMENTVDGGVKYLHYGNGLLKYSQDGATAIDKDGNLKWNGSYEMKKPTADVCDQYAVVADQGGTSIQIFDANGIAGSISTVYNIIKVEISQKGVVAALLETKGSNSIKLYDVDGTELAEIATNVVENGYPIDITLSNDGEKLITSYLSVTTGELIGIATFYNFGEVGQNWTDRMVGAYNFNGMVAPRVAFINNSTACVFKENGFMMFGYSEMPSLIKEITFEKNIDSILYNEEYAGAVLETGETGYHELIIYNLKGEKVLDKKLDFDYTNIYLEDNEIIMYDNVSCIIMKMNGTVKFNYTFDSNIAALYPVNDISQYILASDKAISRISLVEKSK
ncbi:MAG: hypothetical protein H6Q59_2106 [Firmicutes bacterium]|nr:hypothetical protein [Bacillota bacterium]